MVSNSMSVTKTLRAFLLLIAILTLNKSLVNAVFEGCDHNYKISANRIYELKLDNQRLPSCRYRYTAPPNYNVVATCTINFSKIGNSCSNQNFYIAVNGDVNLVGSEKLCGHGTFERSSISQWMVLAYISTGPVGNFVCNVRAKPCYCGLAITRNIANGEEASINEYPSAVALKTIKPSVLFCSATIISNRYLLTAAHCANYYDLQDIVAWVGRHNVESSPAYDTIYAKAYYISKRIVHPEYSMFQNDIALLQTATEIQFNRGVGPICLPPYSRVFDDFSWQEVEAIGWGATRFSGIPSPTLQKISVVATDTETCQEIYRNINTISPTQICTRDNSLTRKDTCEKDSGGPVIYRNGGRQYLIGIISFGKNCAADADPTGINTRITSYLSWIHANTGHSTCTVEMNLQ